MNDAQCPHIFNSRNKLAYNQSAFFLFDSFTHLEEDSEVEAIGILLHHVNV